MTIFKLILYLLITIFLISCESKHNISKNNETNILVLVSDSMGESSWANLMISYISPKNIKSYILLGRHYNNTYKGTLSSASWTNYNSVNRTQANLIDESSYISIPISSVDYNALNSAVNNIILNNNDLNTYHSLYISIPISNIYIESANKLYIYYASHLYYENSTWNMLIGHVINERFFGKYYPFCYIDKYNINNFVTNISYVMKNHNVHWHPDVYNEIITKSIKPPFDSLRFDQSNFLANAKSEVFHHDKLYDFISKHWLLVKTSG